MADSLDAANLADALRDYFNQNVIPLQMINAIEEQLKLSGFVLTSRPKSLVYFMEANPSMAIKIGYSGSLSQAEIRLDQLQIGRHPEKLRIRAVMDGDRTLEKELQRRFEVHTLGGEWFSPHPELLDFIVQNAYDPYNTTS